MQTIDTKYFLTLAGQDRATRLLARAGIAKKGGELPATLDLQLFWRLCAENIQSLNDESHGVAREPVPRGSLSVLIMSAKESDTLLGAVERLSEAANLIRKECAVVVGKSHDAMHLTVRPRGAATVRAEIYVECFAIVVHCALRWMTGRRLDPVHVRGAAKLRAMGATLLPAFNAPWVRRGAGITITYAQQDVNAPILPLKYKAWGDQEFASFLALLHEHDEHDVPRRESATQRAVHRLLGDGLHAQEDVAEALHLSVATLRRRLSDEGTTFRKLSAEIRAVQLRDLLATDIPIEDIAEKLGLSDDRSLRRFCSASLGMPPHEYRQSLRRVPSTGRR